MEDNKPDSMAGDIPDDFEEWKEPERDRGTLRTCVACGCEYYDLDEIDSSYWEHPYAYFDGCSTHCQQVRQCVLQPSKYA